MLIPSHRHTDEDLALWAELEAADRVHGERVLRSGKVERSVDAIRQFMAAGPCYCSTSWGKDSVVVASLCVSAGLLNIGHLVITATTAPNPESPLVRDAFLSRYRINYREVIGSPEVQHDFAKLEEAFGTTRHVSGLRAEESGLRKISARKHGAATSDSCRPLIWWSESDIFGYLAVAGLPVHPAYAMLGGGRWPRQHLRVSSLGGERGTQFGRGEWENEYYGDVLRESKRRPS